MTAAPVTIGPRMSSEPGRGSGVIDKIRAPSPAIRRCSACRRCWSLFLAATVAIHPTFDSFDAQSVAMAALPLAFAAAAQAVVVISGGIDLSIGSVMAVANVLAASTMKDASFGEALLLGRGDPGRRRGDRRGQRAPRRRLSRPRRHRDADHRLYLGRRRAVDTREARRRRASRVPQSRHRHVHNRLAVQFAGSAGRLPAAVIWIPVRRSKTRAAHLRYRQRPDRRVSQRRQRRARPASSPMSSAACSARSAGVGLTMTTGIGSPHAGRPLYAERAGRRRHRRGEPDWRARRDRRGRSSPLSCSPSFPPT